MSFVRVLDINSIIGYVVSRSFLLSHRPPFHLLTVPFAEQSLFHLYSPTSLLLFICLCFWYHIQEIIAKTNIMKFYPVFSSRNFAISSFTFKFLIHLELMVVYGVR